MNSIGIKRLLDNKLGSFVETLVVDFNILLQIYVIIYF